MTNPNLTLIRLNSGPSEHFIFSIAAGQSWQWLIGKPDPFFVESTVLSTPGYVNFHKGCFSTFVTGCIAFVSLCQIAVAHATNIPVFFDDIDLSAVVANAEDIFGCEAPRMRQADPVEHRGYYRPRTRIRTVAC